MIMLSNINCNTRMIKYVTQPCNFNVITARRHPTTTTASRTLEGVCAAEAGAASYRRLLRTVGTKCRSPEPVVGILLDQKAWKYSRISSQ